MKENFEQLVNRISVYCDEEVARVKNEYRKNHSAIVNDTIDECVAQINKTHEENLCTISCEVLIERLKSLKFK